MCGRACVRVLVRVFVVETPESEPDDEHGGDTQVNYRVMSVRMLFETSQLLAIHCTDFNGANTSVQPSSIARVPSFRTQNIANMLTNAT